MDYKVFWKSLYLCSTSIKGITWNGHNWDTVVTACQGVSRMDISVAGGTKRGSIRLAKKGCRSAFTRLANPNALMTWSHKVCCMYAGVTARTQICRIGPAVNGACSRPASVAHLCPVVAAVFLFQHWTNFGFFFLLLALYFLLYNFVLLSTELVAGMLWT